MSKDQMSIDELREVCFLQAKRRTGSNSSGCLQGSAWPNQVETQYFVLRYESALQWRDSRLSSTIEYQLVFVRYHRWLHFLFSKSFDTTVRVYYIYSSRT